MLPFILLLTFEIFPFKDRITTTFSILIFIIYIVTIFIIFKSIYKINNELNGFIQYTDINMSFSDIASVLNKTEYLKEIAYHYKKTLRPIKSGIDHEENSGEYNTEYYATKTSDYYFNEDTLIYNQLPLTTINFMPQVLTGIGIFGTFLGIVKGVSGLSEEMSGSEIQDAIGTLFSGVEVSFTTSLYGISFSIALTVLIKIIFDILNSKIRVINNIIDNSLNNNIEKEGLKELERELTKQTSAMERLATDISEDLGKKIDISLQESMNSVSENISKLTDEIKNSFEGSVIENITPALERLSLVSEELGNMQQSSTNNFISDAISRMEKVLSTGTENEISKLKQTMEVMSEKNNEFIMKFVDGIGNIEKLFNSQKQLIDNTNDSAENVNITTQSINQLQSNLGLLISDMNTMHKTNNTSMESISEMYEKIKELTSQQSNLSASFNDMINKTYEHGKLQEQYLDKLQASNSNLSNNIRSTEEYVNIMTNHIKEYTNNFNEIKNSSLDITDKLNANYTDIIEKLKFSSNTLNDSIAKIDIDIISNIGKVGNEVFDLSKNLNEACNKMEKLTFKFEDFATVENSTQELWRDYKVSFTDLNQNINDGIINYTDQIKKGTYDIFKNYDEKVAEAVTNLSSMVEILNNEITEIKDVFEDLHNEINNNIIKAS